MHCVEVAAPQPGLMEWHCMERTLALRVGLNTEEAGTARAKGTHKS